MNVAILLNQGDAELFLSRRPTEEILIIAGGVDTFTYLEHHHILYQRLTKYFRLQQTRIEWKRAKTISSRFLKQPCVTSLYRKTIDYRYPIHQHLKYLLTDIVRNQGIAERILTENKPVICYISNTLTEPLVQKLHNQEFTLVNHVLIQLCKQRNIQVHLIQKHHYFHYLNLTKILLKLITETLINATRSTIKRNRHKEQVDETKQTVLFSASNHLLTNTRLLIRRLVQQWYVTVIGKLNIEEETKFKQQHIKFVHLNTLIRQLSFVHLVANALLTFRIFMGFILLPSKLKQQYFDKALGVPLWHLLGPSLGLYSSLLIYEITLYSRYIQQLWRRSPFNFVLASNNIDPFHFALLSFARRQSIPYALLIHDAQGNTFCDFFFKPKDALLVWGDFQYRMIKRDYPKLRCMITGHPDFDNVTNLCREHLPISNFLSKRKLKILVLSTYNPYVQFPNQEILFDVFKELDKIKKYQISVTLKSHPSEHHAKLVHLVQRTIGYPIRWSLKDADTLIRKNDIIITQSTSVGLRAIIFHKPIIYLNIHDFKNYEPYAKTSAALGVYSLHQLNSSIEALTRNPYICEKSQIKFVQDFCYKLDGKSSQRIVEYIQTTINAS